MAIAIAVGACGFPKLPKLDDGEPLDDGGVPGGDGGVPGGDGGLGGPDTGELALVLLAGSIGGPGNLDGPGAVARFTNPQAMCVDPTGNLYVIDTQAIRKITSTGLVSTLAGRWNSPGSIDGPGDVARFYNPSGLAADSTGNLYVADTGNHTIRKVTPLGQVTTVAGLVSMPGSVDGAGATARFRYPEGVSVYGSDVYVTDTGNHTVRKITSSGVVTTVAGSAGTSGAVDGQGTAARFYEPRGIAMDMNGNLVVADVQNYTVRRVNAASQVVSTLAGTARTRGAADGAGNAATFFDPRSLAADGANGFYVAEPGAGKIRRVTSEGEVSTMVLPPGLPSLAAEGLVVKTGDLYATSSNDVVLRWRASGAIETFAGERMNNGYAEGAGAAAQFGALPAVATASADAILVADPANRVIRKVATNGSTSLWAGAPAVRGASDGVRLDARFESPNSLATTSRGEVYVADGCAIRKVDAQGDVTTLAGVSTACAIVDGVGQEARFGAISALVVDESGNVYVAQKTQYILRKVTPQGEVSTFAGTVNMNGLFDGAGSAARFSGPAGLAIDRFGTLYVADEFNQAIRKVTSAGVVTTLAGNGTFGHVDATGPLARFFSPSAVTVDAAGNVYVADTGNRAIRKVTPAGVVTTIAGSPASIGIRLGTSPSFANPSRLALLGDTLLIVDGPSVIALRHGAR